MKTQFTESGFQDVNQRYRSDSEQQTAAIASDLARGLRGGTVVLLFVQGVGIDPDEVSSPTFTVIHEYGSGRVYHVDLYRLEPDEVGELGLEELPEKGGLVCIEWADRIAHTVPGAISVEHVALPYSCWRNTNHPGVFLEFGDGAASTIAHARSETADELMNHRADRTLVGYAAFNTLWN